jgi:hypothetical protein
VGYTLQFLLMVDADLDRAGLLAVVRGRFPDAVPGKENSCDVHGNWLEIWPNEGADPALATTDEDAYLYYRWRVELTPLDGEGDEDHQVALARELLAAFTAAGARAEVLSSFEDRV